MAKKRGGGRKAARRSAPKRAAAKKSAPKAAPRPAPKIRTVRNPQAPAQGVYSAMQPVQPQAPQKNLGKKQKQKVNRAIRNNRKGGNEAQAQALIRVLDKNPKLKEAVMRNPGSLKALAIDPVTAGMVISSVGSAIGGAFGGGQRDPEQFDQYSDQGRKDADKSANLNDQTRTEGSEALGSELSQGGKVRNEGLKTAKEQFLISIGKDPSKMKVNKNGEPVIPQKFRNKFKNQVKNGVFSEYGLSLGKNGKIQGKNTFTNPSFEDTDIRSDLETSADEFNQEVFENLDDLFNDYAEDASYGLDQRKGIMDFLAGSFNVGPQGLSAQDEADIAAQLEYNLDEVKRANKGLMQQNIGRLLTTGTIDGTYTGSVIRDNVQEGTNKLLRGAVADNAEFRQKILNDKVNRLNSTRSSASGVLSALGQTPLSTFTGSIVNPGQYGGVGTKDKYDINSGLVNDAQTNRRDDAKLNVETEKQVIA